ncbi:MAG: hypothetical protein M3081_16630 [Gemmatimonadota bacterium]|nr:hypothetical protein [Gemmatimonadota bacterium]
MDEHPTIRRDSSAWLFFVRACFAISVGATTVGLCYLPVDAWIKGYVGMGMLFTIGSSITLTKTLRDDHEAQRLLSRISEAKTTKLLREFDPIET